MEYNWCALIISILKKCTPEQAFESLEKCSPIKYHQNKTITKHDVMNMIKLKKKLTYQQIGDLYGMSKDAVFKRIKKVSA